MAALGGLPAAASAQLQIAIGIENPEGGAPAVTCEDAPPCDTSCDEAAGMRCVTIGEQEGCLAEGEVLCCEGNADCGERPGLEAKCAVPTGSPDGVCVWRAPNEADICPTTLSNADRLEACFDEVGDGGFREGDCDADGVSNAEDNCLCTANDDQLDCNGDGVGAVCTASKAPGGAANPQDLCAGAETWEEVQCAGSTGMGCDCYRIEGPDDPWCDDPACVALDSVFLTRDECEVRTRPDGGPAPADAGVVADAGSPAGDADAGAEDGGTEAPEEADDDGGCSTAGDGGPLAGAFLVALGLLLLRRRVD